LFHNPKSYDAHLVIKHFQRKYVESRNSSNEAIFNDIEITPVNSEKYHSFQIGNLRFLNAYQFFFDFSWAIGITSAESGRENCVHSSKHLGSDDEVFDKT